MEIQTEEKTIFAVSDIHGHASLLIDALCRSGFDPDDPGHLLVVCGDCFDRGEENGRVMRFLESVGNKVLVRGNHEDLLTEAMERGTIDYRDLVNGTDITICELFGEEALSRAGKLELNEEKKEKILSFFARAYDWFETERFVFTHGWIPLTFDPFDEKQPVRIDPAWRTATKGAWEDARFLEWQQTYGAGLTLPDKTLVVGHRPTSLARLFDPRREPDDARPFFGDRMIAIDACTVRSGTVNVLKVTDRLLPAVTHEMKLNDAPYDVLEAGTKTVEMRLCDEKRKSIRPGDRILFRKRSDPAQSFYARVTGTHRYEDFFALAEDFSGAELGSPGLSAERIGNEMTGFYGLERVRENGVLALRVCREDEKT